MYAMYTWRRAHLITSDMHVQHTDYFMKKLAHKSSNNGSLVLTLELILSTETYDNWYRFISKQFVPSLYMSFCNGAYVKCLIFVHNFCEFCAQILHLSAAICIEIVFVVTYICSICLIWRQVLGDLFVSFCGSRKFYDRKFVIITLS